MLAADPHTSRSSPDRFVGRDAELAALEADMRAVPSTSGPVRLLHGVSGVGKTRLAEEFSRRVAAGGVSVAWAHGSDELTAPPFWPWTQVIRSLVGVDRGTDLAALVLDGPGAVDRFELFDACAAVVRAASANGPLLIVLDDLHTADLATLQLTRFLARHLGDSALMLVATVQDRPDLDPVVIEHLDALARLGRVHEMHGLDRAAVGELLADDAHAGAVHSVTGGNPLFVHQMLHALHRVIDASEPATAGELQDAMRRTIEGRIIGLDATARTVLTCAAVLAPVIDRRELAALAEPLDPVEIDTALQRLRAHGFLTGDDPDRFAHGLIAEVARDSLDPTQRHRLHQRAASLIGADDERAGEAAHHLLQAGPSARAAAVAMSRRAGELAAGAAAHEDAVLHLTRAVGAIDADTDGPLRLDVLLDLAAALWRAGRTADAHDVHEDAWAQAEALGDAESLARAVLRNGVEYYFTDTPTHAATARVEAALGAQPEGPSPTRARLLAELATRHLARDPETGQVLACEAVDMARSFEDAVALGNALIARQVTDLGPATVRRRIADSHEILACASDADDYRLAMHGRFLLMGALLEAGDIGALDGQLLLHDGATEDLGEPRYDRFALWLRATRAMFEGNIDLAESLAERTFEISTALADPDALGVFGGQIGVLRWMQGRVNEMEPLYAQMRSSEPAEPLWPSVLAWLAATHGRTDSARGLLASVPDPVTLPGGMHWLLTASTYAEAAALVGTREQVDIAWNALVPYADHMVPIAMGAAVWGTVARPLGHLALRRGDPDEGIAYLRAAVHTCARLGARPWMVEAQLDLADALAAHGGDDDAVAALRAEAADTAGRLGLALFLQRIEDSTSSAATPRGDAPATTVNGTHLTVPAPATTDPGEPHRGASSSGTGERVTDTRATGPNSADPNATPEPPYRPVVRVIGGFEVVNTAGVRARWSSRKARQLLKILVSRRGAPVDREALMDLLWPGDDPSVLANRLSVALSTVRRALDPQRLLAPGDLISTSFDAVALNLEVVRVDVELLLEHTRSVLAAARPDDDQSERTAADRAAELLDQHRGEALPDEPHAEWASALRGEVRMAMTALARLVAADAEARGDHRSAVEAHHRILVIDPYDETANLGTVAAFRAMGAHGQARAAYDAYASRMAELGVPPAQPTQ